MTTLRDLLLALADHAARMGPIKATDVARYVGKEVRQLERVPGMEAHIVTYSGSKIKHMDASGIRLVADEFCG